MMEKMCVYVELFYCYKGKKIWYIHFFLIIWENMSHKKVNAQLCSRKIRKKKEEKKEKCK